MASDPGTVGNVLAGATAGTAGLSEEIAQLADQLQQLQTASQAATESLRASSRETTGGSSASGSIGSALLDVFAGGLGLNPLISGLASLFGGGGGNSTSGSTTLPLTRFALPPSIQAQGGVRESGGPPFAVDNPQGGLPRAAPVQAPAQITVQVQAMDSQSFLDHSADIAMAVRQAMLESSVLNDVVREA
jgi:hypothetical protein